MMGNASFQEEAYNLSASGAPAAEAIEAAAVYHAEEIQVMEAEEGSIVRGLAQPSQPAAREVSARNLTHLPFRAWCRHCVRAKGVTTAHKHLVDDLGRRVPEISKVFFWAIRMISAYLC